MSIRAYNRATRVIRTRIDHELAERRRVCGGTYRNGPDKRFCRCDTCRRIDYEANEGDRCRRSSNP